MVRGNCFVELCLILQRRRGCCMLRDSPAGDARLSVRGDRFVKLRLVFQGVGQIKVEYSKTRPEPQCLLVGCDGFIQFSLVAQRIAQIAVGLRIFGPKTQGGLAGGLGLVKLSLVPQNDAQIVVRPREIPVGRSASP